MPAQDSEIEAKFAVARLDPVRQALQRLAARQIRPRLRESNVRFDQADGRLARAGQVLRLRHNHETRLTFKAPGAVFEQRQEIEVGVEDAAGAQRLLQALSFEPVFVYEKYRETFAVSGVQVMLDELPFGLFVEIEGPDLERVRRTSENLGFAWEDRLAHSYLGLFERLSRHHRWSFRDATFANFADVRPPTPDELRDVLRAP